MLWAIWVILCWMGLVVISAAIATVVGRFLGWEEELYGDRMGMEADEEI